jgi:peptide/nickel transport system ATP-binding protein
MALLEVEDLRVSFSTDDGVVQAVRGVSFQVDRGETLGLVGESGSGKSVATQTITGLTRGAEVHGRALFDGRDLLQASREELRAVRGPGIGMIFQDPLTSLDPLYRIGDQLVETILTHEKISPAAARDKAERLLVEVGIPGAGLRLASYPHQFSGGMRQRVVIALALAADPALVIADEPTTALDVSVQAQIIALIKRLCRERGASVMLITHDMGVIAETADRVCVLYAGRLAEIGAVRDVVKRPQHPYTAGLMAAIPSLGDEVGGQLAQIPGSMPRLDAIPKGCAFHPRCAYTFERCIAARPSVYETASSDTACFLHDPQRAAVTSEGAA